jgi:hypothetical protein
MRGLIMAETSDLDELMVEIIEILLNSGISDKISTYIKQEIAKTIKFNSELAQNKETETSEKIKDSRIFTSFHKAKTINKLYKLKEIGIDKFFESYNKDNCLSASLMLK